jgi:hypothetical protein
MELLCICESLHYAAVSRIALTLPQISQLMVNVDRPEDYTRNVCKCKMCLVCDLTAPSCGLSFDRSAIYFMLPTQENVEQLCKDLKANLYDQYHVNFIGTTPRALLERLADSALESDSVSLITKVHDQYLGFQALGPTMFALAMPQSYVAFNDARASDAQAQANIERCVEGLFAVLSVSGVVPIIRCARNGAAEMVARNLSTRLHEHASARAGVALSGAATAISSFRRPLLVVLERGVDLGAMLHHPWSYAAMVHDVLGLRLNRVRVPDDDAPAPAAAAAAAGGAAVTTTDRVFDLDARDSFWSAQV